MKSYTKICRKEVFTNFEKREHWLGLMCFSACSILFVIQFIYIYIYIVYFPQVVSVDSIFYPSTFIPTKVQNNEFLACLTVSTYHSILCFNMSKLYLNTTKEMISRLKCNFLRNQEVYDIYKYIICLLILNSWNWYVFFRGVVVSKAGFVDILFLWIYIYILFFW